MNTIHIGFSDSGSARNVTSRQRSPRNTRLGERARRLYARSPSVFGHKAWPQSTCRDGLVTTGNELVALRRSLAIGAIVPREVHDGGLLEKFASDAGDL